MGLTPLVAALGCGLLPAPTPSASSNAPPATVPHLEELALLQLMADRNNVSALVAANALEGSEGLRLELARVLARIDHPDVADLLAQLLVDPSPLVRREAAFSFRVVRPEGGVRYLQGLFGDDDRETAIEAILSGAALGASYSDVSRILDVGDPAEVLARLAPALPLLTQSSESVGAARLAVETESGLPLSARRAAALALAASGPEQLDLLRQTATSGSEDDWVVAFCLEGLGRFGGAGDLELLVARTSGPAPVAAAAWDAASRLVDRGVAPPSRSHLPALLTALQRDPWSVRRSVLRAAAYWLPEESLEAALEGRFDSEDLSGEERGVALAALLRGPRARPELVGQALISPNAEVRRAVLPFASPEQVAALLVDRDSQVRQEALTRRLGFLSEPEDRAELLGWALGTESEGLRIRALELLQIQPVMPFDQLVRRTVLGPTPAAVRVALGRALHSRAVVEPLERGAITERLEGLSGDRDRSVARVSRELLVRLGRVPRNLSGPTGRGVEYYRELIRRSRQRRFLEVRFLTGSVLIEVDCPRAPQSCLSLFQLAQQGFYNGLDVHDVEEAGWVAMGDPSGDGYGSPGYLIPAEPNSTRFDRPGIVALEPVIPGASGSRLLITWKPWPQLDREVVPVGWVLAGLEVVRELPLGAVIQSVREVSGSEIRELTKDRSGR